MMKLLIADRLVDYNVDVLQQINFLLVVVDVLLKHVDLCVPQICDPFREPKTILTNDKQ